MSKNGHGMDLKDFIYTTLTSIREGIIDANKPTNNKFSIYGAEKVITFDIAVEVSNEGKVGAGGGVKIHVAEVKVGKDNTTKESNVNRISFSVGLRGDVY